MCGLEEVFMQLYSILLLCIVITFFPKTVLFILSILVFSLCVQNLTEVNYSNLPQFEVTENDWENIKKNIDELFERKRNLSNPNSVQTTTT